MDSLKQPTPFDDVESFTTADTIDTEDVIEPPVMPPKKEFQVELTVKSIQRGTP